MTPDAGRPELAVVIPAWNERENLELPELEGDDAGSGPRPDGGRGS